MNYLDLVNIVVNTHSGSHASGLVDGTAAAEECNYENHSTQRNKEDRSQSQVYIMEVFLKIVQLQVNGNADGNNGNTTEL